MFPKSREVVLEVETINFINERKQLTPIFKKKKSHFGKQLKPSKSVPISGIKPLTLQSNRDRKLCFLDLREGIEECDLNISEEKPHDLFGLSGQCVSETR